MKKINENISTVIAPMMAITIELDTVIGSLLRDKFAMSLADFKIMRAVHLLGGACSQLEVACFNQVTEAAVSKRVKSLSDNGLIKKQVDTKDGRKAVLSLTKKGQILMGQLQGAVISSMESMLVDFSKTKRKQMTSLLLEILGMIIKNGSQKGLLMKSNLPNLDRLKGCKVSDK